MNQRTFCRLCEGACGLVADVDGGALRALAPDTQDPVSGGFICDVATRSVGALAAPGRITQPLHRSGGRLVPVSWDEAIRGVADALKKARAQGEARSIGLYLGEALQRSDRGLVRSLATAAALGTPSVFSELSEGAGPRLLAAERALGHAVPLLPDIGRAHYVLALGGEQEGSGWGPLIRGRAHGDWLAHSRRTKGTKLVVAGPRATDFAREATQHLAIRPGSEPFLLLGMLVAVVKGGWHDPQFVRDYTRGWDALVDALAPWSVERCAARCGVDAAAISGVALKFSRAAMAVAVPDGSTFSNSHAGLTAWAWMTLHTVTANTLRPGGLYDHEGVFDLHHALAMLRSERAPRTRTGGHPLVLMQAPAAALVDEVLVPGEGQVTALLCVRGDPAGRLPGAARVEEALRALGTLVCLSTHHDDTTAMADWVLPVLHPWEREDLETVGAALLPRDAARYTPAVAAPAGEARHEADILAELAASVGAARGAWGWHLGLAGRQIVKADLSAWERNLAGWLSDSEWEGIEAAGGLDQGESDRSLWRISHEDGLIELFPEGTLPLLQAAGVDDAAADLPMRLRTSAARSEAPDAAHGDGADAGIGLHPDAGLVDGARVRVRTRHGSVEGVVHLDDRLRADTVDIPREASVRATLLLSADRLDALTGTAERDGLACAVEPVDGAALG
jgi:anaerobic selenocysteine-containing dehydrogenase